VAKLEKQSRAYALATRFFDHNPNSNRERGLPLLRVCSNRPLCGVVLGDTLVGVANMLMRLSIIQMLVSY